MGVFGYPDFEFDMPEPVEKARYSAPGGDIDLVVYLRDAQSTYAQIAFVPASHSVEDNSTAGPSFHWLHEADPLPISINWNDERSVRLNYCGTPIYGQNFAEGPFGTVDIEVIKENGCSLNIAGKLSGGFGRPIFLQGGF